MRKNTLKYKVITNQDQLYQMRFILISLMKVTLYQNLYQLILENSKDYQL